MPPRCWDLASFRRWGACRRGRMFLCSVLIAVAAVSCSGCGARDRGSRGVLQCGYIPPTPCSSEVTVNPNVLEFHATDGDSLQSPPMMVDVQLPAYPDLAVRAGIEGRVLLDLVIGRSGIVICAENHARGPHLLIVRAALEAARKWEFAPARRDGSPVACRAVVELMFKLTEVSESQSSRTDGKDN